MVHMNSRKFFAIFKKILLQILIIYSESFKIFPVFSPNFFNISFISFSYNFKILAIFYNFLRKIVIKYLSNFLKIFLQIISKISVKYYGEYLFRKIILVISWPDQFFFFEVGPVVTLGVGPAGPLPYISHLNS